MEINYRADTVWAERPVRLSIGPGERWRDDRSGDGGENSRWLGLYFLK